MRPRILLFLLLLATLLWQSQAELHSASSSSNLANYTGNQHSGDSFDSYSNGPLVKTSLGVLRGYIDHTASGQPVRIFKGVPFAAAPVGDRRWRLPSPPPPWTGTRDARAYASACLTNSTETSSPQKDVSEDCLYLNIFSGPKCTETSHCPVVVYLHGGDMNYDSAVMFNDSFLIRSFSAQDIVLVLPAFRLGFAGAIDFGEPDVVPQNIGLYDVIESLRFLRREIDAFGGDADQLTLLGHSYGASLSAFVTCSPLVQAENLVSVHRFVGLSPQFRFRDNPPHVGRARELARRANCSRESVADTVECLRNISGIELLRIQRQMQEEDPAKETFGDIAMVPPLFPFKRETDLFRHAPPIEVVVGTTKAEMDDFQGSPGFHNGGFVDARNLDELDEIARWKSRSNSGFTHSPTSQSLILSTAIFARAVQRNGGKAFVYKYDMDHHNEHTTDLAYIMGVHRFDMDDNEKVIDTFYSRLFTNFSKFGEPSPLWREFDADDSFFSIRVEGASAAADQEGLPRWSSFGRGRPRRRGLSSDRHHRTDISRWPEMRRRYEEPTIAFWTRDAPRLDRVITAAKAAGGRLSVDKMTGELRMQDGEFNATADSSDDDEEEKKFQVVGYFIVREPAGILASVCWLLLLLGCVFAAGYFVGVCWRTRRVGDATASRPQRVGDAERMPLLSWMRRTDAAAALPYKTMMR